MPRSARPRKAYRPRPTDTLHMRLDQVHKIFRPIDTIIERLKEGEIEAAQGVPIFKDWQDRWCVLHVALDGWADCFDRISRYEGLSIDTDPLRKLATKLDYASPITPAEVAAVEALMSHCRQILRRLPLARVRSHMTTEEIASKVESLGLQEA